MKLPSFQFYPGDWLKDSAVRRCSHAARGFWIDLLCVMFDCEQRGILATGENPWSDDEIAASVTGSATTNLTLLCELLSKGVCSRNEAGAIFSRRMVRDENLRKVRQESGSLGGKSASKHGSKTQANVPAKLEQNPEDEDEDEEYKEEVREGETKKNKGAIGYPVEFERFWSVFPIVRRQAKATAHKAWLSAIKRLMVERSIDKAAAIAILQFACEEFAASPAGKGQFCPMPATWLNGGRWDDDRTSWQNNGETNGKSNRREAFVSDPGKKFREPGR